MVATRRQHLTATPPSEPLKIRANHDAMYASTVISCLWRNNHVAVPTVQPHRAGGAARFGARSDRRMERMRTCCRRGCDADGKYVGDFLILRQNFGNTDGVEQGILMGMGVDGKDLD